LSRTSIRRRFEARFTAERMTKDYLAVYARLAPPVTSRDWLRSSATDGNGRWGRRRHSLRRFIPYCQKKPSTLSGSFRTLLLSFTIPWLRLMPQPLHVGSICARTV